MSSLTLRQRAALDASRQAAARQVVLDQLRRVPTPKRHFEDTVAGMCLAIAVAFIALGVVGVRFFHIAIGGTP